MKMILSCIYIGTFLCFIQNELTKMTNPNKERERERERAR